MNFKNIALGLITICLVSQCLDPIKQKEKENKNAFYNAFEQGDFIKAFDFYDKSLKINTELNDKRDCTIIK